MVIALNVLMGLTFLLTLIGTPVLLKAGQVHHARIYFGCCAAASLIVCLLLAWMSRDGTAAKAWLAAMGILVPVFAVAEKVLARRAR